MKDLVKIELPFSGFYESIHDQEIDDAIEREFSYNYETDEEQEITPEVSDAIYAADVNWQEIREEYCKNFVEAFGDKYELTLTYDALWSPREYNFSSDRLFALIPREEIDKIRKEVEAHAEWPAHVEANFKSYDGFISFISNDYKHEDWTKETLTEAQYEVIIRYWLNNISVETSSEGWHMDEVYMCDDFEMSNWDSIIKAHEAIETYVKEKK